MTILKLPQVPSHYRGEQELLVSKKWLSESRTCINVSTIALGLFSSFLNVTCLACWLPAFANLTVLQLRSVPECPKWLLQLPPFSYLVYLSILSCAEHAYTCLHTHSAKCLSIYKMYLRIQSLVWIQKRNSACLYSANHIPLYSAVCFWLALSWWYLFWCVVDAIWNLAPCECLGWPDFLRCWYSGLRLLLNHWNFLWEEQMQQRKKC